MNFNFFVASWQMMIIIEMYFRSFSISSSIPQKNYFCKLALWKYIRINSQQDDKVFNTAFNLSDKIKLAKAVIGNTSI